VKDIIKSDRKTLLKTLEDNTESWLDMLDSDDAEIMEKLESTPSITTFETLPTVSVQVKDVVFIVFDGEPDVKKSPKDNTKELGYANGRLLKEHRIWNRKEKKEEQGKVGQKVSMNLKRHINLWRGMEANLPITGKAFVIGNLRKVKTKTGYACDYRVQQIPSNKALEILEKK